jgi:ribosomal-protein-alanine N-acetyltransferase
MTGDVDHPGELELRTERLVLRPFRQGDVGDVLAYASDREWSRFLDIRIPYPYTRADAESFVALAMLNWAAGDLHWAIVLEGRVVGAISLGLPFEGGAASLGYNLGRAEWGRGLVTEAAGAVLDYAFFVEGMESIEATADARNVGSWRVMEKLGMTRVGVEPGGRRDQEGAVVDQVRYRVDRERWAG